MCQDRLDHFPDAWIQAGRFAGRDKSAILDHARLDMHPLRAIDVAALSRQCPPALLLARKQPLHRSREPRNP